MKCPYCRVELTPRRRPQVLPDRQLGKWVAIDLGDCPRCGTTRALGEPRVLSDQGQIKYPSLDGLTPGPRDIESAS